VLGLFSAALHYTNLRENSNKRDVRF